MEGKVRWEDFLAAMKNAGCSVSRKGGAARTFRGPSVKFTDGRLGKGSIDFHEPHPEPTLDQHDIRVMAWRLTKRFGWNDDTFVLSERQSA